MLHILLLGGKPLRRRVAFTAVALIFKKFVQQKSSNMCCCWQKVHYNWLAMAMRVNIMSTSFGRLKSCFHPQSRRAALSSNAIGQLSANAAKIDNKGF